MTMPLGVKKNTSAPMINNIISPEINFGIRDTFVMYNWYILCQRICSYEFVSKIS